MPHAIFFSLHSLAHKIYRKVKPFRKAKERECEGGKSIKMKLCQQTIFTLSFSTDIAFSFWSIELHKLRICTPFLHNMTIMRFAIDRKPESSSSLTWVCVRSELEHTLQALITCCQSGEGIWYDDLHRRDRLEKQQKLFICNVSEYIWEWFIVWKLRWLVRGDTKVMEN